MEWAHAIAPGAKIILVEATNSSSLFTAVTWAGQSSGAQVVSMSWGGSESSGETTDDTSIFVSPFSHGVTYTASTGEDQFRRAV